MCGANETSWGLLNHTITTFKVCGGRLIFATMTQYNLQITRENKMPSKKMGCLFFLMDWTVDSIKLEVLCSK